MLKASALMDGKKIDIDVIEYQNDLWLVPYWTYTPDRKYAMPLRIIRMAGMERMGNLVQLMLPVTTQILSGHVPQNLVGAIEVLENPPLKFANPDAH